jgi:hypothetical protein
MHWIQDCFHYNNDPDHTVFDEDALAEVQSRAQIHKSDLELVDTNTKAADPGKFKDERKWPDWRKDTLFAMKKNPMMKRNMSISMSA